MIPPTSHVAVIGGGIVGAAIAFSLVQSGLGVTLVEPDPFGAHASGNNPGNLNPILNTPQPLRPFALESFRLHLALAERLAALDSRECALEPVRRILLAFDGSPDAGYQNLLHAFEGQDGFSARPLDRKALRELEPRLADDVRAGLLISGNMSVDSRALTCALAEGAVRLGAKHRPGRVRGLRTVSRRVEALRIGSDEIACDAVVLATGAWVAETKQWLGISLPIEPVKGQMLKMRLPGPGLNFDLSHDEISLYRRRGDEVWVGVTLEPGRLDEQPTDDGREHLLAGADRILPGIAQATLLRHSAAVRPQAPSGYPIVGPAAAWENVYVANGLGAKGVLLCAGVAQAVRDLLVSGRTSLSLNFQTC